VSRTHTLLFLTALLLLAAPARAEDAPKTKKIANPEYASWSKFKVGAYAELTSVSEAMGQKTTTKMTHKLVELTEEKAVVETSMSSEGIPAEYAPKPTRRDVPKEIVVPVAPPAPEGDQPKPEVKEGEETIDVAGTQVKCKTIESTVKASGMTTTTKVWTSSDVPGMTAKMTSRTEGKVGETTFVSSSTTTVTKWAAK